MDGGRLDDWQRLFAAAFRSPAGELTLAVVNDAPAEFLLKLTLQGMPKPASLYRYRYGEAQQNRVDIIVDPQAEFALTPQANVLEDTLPANSLTVSTYHLEHGSPGLIMEPPKQATNYARSLSRVLPRLLRSGSESISSCTVAGRAGRALTRAVALAWGLAEAVRLTEGGSLSRPGGPAADVRSLPETLWPSRRATMIPRATRRRREPTHDTPEQRQQEVEHPMGLTIAAGAIPCLRFALLTPCFTR
jgi:hypothetical protein